MVEKMLKEATLPLDEEAFKKQLLTIPGVHHASFHWKTPILMYINLRAHTLLHIRITRYPRPEEVETLKRLAIDRINAIDHKSYRKYMVDLQRIINLPIGY
jgi:hypothetical protein